MAVRPLSNGVRRSAIASVHAASRSPADTPWSNIVGFYDTLLRLQPSPVVALNRALAIAQRDGPKRGLDEIARIADSRRLVDYPIYPAAIAELHFRSGDLPAAREHFVQALRLARSPMERRLLERRLGECDTPTRQAVNGAASLASRPVERNRRSMP